MKLVGDLKEKVEQAETQEEAKELIREAGMELTTEEMAQVTGGDIGRGQFGSLASSSMPFRSL